MTKTKKSVQTGNTKLLAMGVGAALLLLIVAFFMTSNSSSTDLNTTIAAKSAKEGKEGKGVKKVVYSGHITPTEASADKVVKDEEDPEMVYYWKKIPVKELNMTNKDSIPMITIYSQDVDDFKDAVDSYSVVDGYDYVFDSGFVWVRYMTKNTQDNTNHVNVGDYRIVLVY